MDPARATTADETLNSIVDWLRDCLTAIEKRAQDTILLTDDLLPVLARVEAERRILQLWEEPDADAWLDLVVIDLAYGHRFDIPGYEQAWVPKWAGDAQ